MSKDFLQLNTKHPYLISGVANKKSVATAVASLILDQGAQVILMVQNESCRQQARKLFPPSTPIYLCDVENADDQKNLGLNLQKDGLQLAGFLHSMAFAHFTQPPTAFHDTPLEYFSQAGNISWLSLVTLSKVFHDFQLFIEDASVVTVSISNTKATSYGYLGPIKAALESSVAYLAKSFSEFSRIRFNAVCAGPLKTSASAGIPDYLDNYLFAEQLMLRKEGLKTEEVAKTICFLLSQASSGINASSLLIDGGMSCNYFDQKIVKTVAKNL